MNRLELFRELQRHRKLAEKRALNLSQNKVAKWILGFVAALMILYLIFFAIIFAMVANSDEHRTSLEFIMGMLPFILTLDFLLRFTTQQTPSQLVKPYLLLPIGKNTCVDMFICTSMLNTNNLIWMALFVPFALMSVVFTFGVTTTVVFLLVCWLLIVVNSQWYLICRTIVIDSQLWWLLPIAVYALIFSPIYIGKHAGISQFFDLYGYAGTLIEENPTWLLLFCVVLLVGVYAINRPLQYSHVRAEVTESGSKTMKHVTQLKTLDKYGELGEYIKLEIKSIMRNKNPKKSFIASSVVVLMFSLVIAFTDIYSQQVMSNFWCIYNFVIYGATMLTRVMCNEGNYIDALMVRKQNILTLLIAKYWFFILLLFIPFMLMLPPVFTGKWSLLMLISYAVFTAGFQYFLLFQMAVYNKQTVPLNTKFVAKAGIENNYIQVVVQFVAMLVPVFFVSILQSFMSNNIVYAIMLTIGIAFIASNKKWMGNIYKRMMKRRYENMASFRASR